MIGICTTASPGQQTPVRYRTANSELIELPGGTFFHRGPTTGGAWVRIPLDALLAVAVYVEKAA